MIDLLQTIKIKDTGTNVIVSGDLLYYYEKNEIKALKNYEPFWSYTADENPYQLHHYNSSILFQKAQAGDIIVLNEAGQPQQKIGGELILHNLTGVVDFILLYGLHRTADNQTAWMKLDRKFDVIPTRLDLSAASKFVHGGCIYDKFSSIRCWNLDKEQLIWEKDVTLYKKYVVFGKEYETDAFALYFEDGIVIAVFYKWLVALNTKNGEVIWEQEFKIGGFGPWGFVEKGTLYTYSESAWYRKIDVKTGKILYEEQELLTYIDPENGKKIELRSLRLANVVNTPDYFVGGTCRKGFLYLIDKNTGKATTHRLAENSAVIYQTIQYVGGLLYVPMRYSDYQDLMIYDIKK